MITTIWKKLTAAVFWTIALGLAALAWLFHAATPQQGRHAAPRPRKGAEDAKTIAWLARLHEVPARVMARPFLRQRAQLKAVTMSITADDQASAKIRAAQAKLGGVPWADLDQYLTEEAKQRPAGVPWDQYLTGRYPADFDGDHPELAGELIKPWLGPQVGDITLDAPMTYRPEPPLEPLPPARACPDTPVNIEQWREPRQHYATGLCWCGRCHDQAPGQHPKWCVHRMCNNSIGQPGFCLDQPDAPQDVPGPADSASPPPPSGNGAEAATPEAVTSAGPGTTTYAGAPSSSAEQSACTAGSREGVRQEAAGSNPAPAAGVPDVTNLDDTGWLTALTGWALHAPLDQVTAVTR